MTSVHLSNCTMVNRGGLTESCIMVLNETASRIGVSAEKVIRIFAVDCRIRAKDGRAIVTVNTDGETKLILGWALEAAWSCNMNCNSCGSSASGGGGGSSGIRLGCGNSIGGRNCERIGLRFLREGGCCGCRFCGCQRNCSCGRCRGRRCECSSCRVDDMTAGGGDLCIAEAMRVSSFRFSSFTLPWGVSSGSRSRSCNRRSVYFSTCL